MEWDPKGAGLVDGKEEVDDFSLAVRVLQHCRILQRVNTSSYSYKDASFSHIIG